MSHEGELEKQQLNEYGPWADPPKFGDEVLIARYCPKRTKYEALNDQFMGFLSAPEFAPTTQVCWLCYGQKKVDEYYPSCVVLESIEYDLRQVCQGCGQVL